MGGKSCLYCFYSEEVKNVSQIKPGMHVRFGRKGIKSVGFLYWHHAIVIAVNAKNEEITHIHFNKPKSKPKGSSNNASEENTRKATSSFKIHIKKETTKLDDKTMANMFIVRRKFSHSLEEAVQRAEDLYQKFQTGKSNDLTYNLFTNNCEHLALYCTTGNSSCIQLKDAVDKSFDTMTIVNEFLRFLANIDKFFRANVFLAKTVGWILEGCITVGTIASLVAEIYNLQKHFDEGILCNFCYKLRLWKAVLCIVWSVLSCTSFYLVCFLTKGAVIVLIVLSVVSILISVVVYKVSSFLRHRKAPFMESQKLRVTSFADVNPGDVINFSHFHLRHDAIVVTCSPENKIKVGLVEIGEKKVMRQCETLNIDTLSLYTKDRALRVLSGKKNVESFNQPDALWELSHFLLAKVHVNIFDI